MINLIYIIILVYNHPIISLMVLQEIVMNSIRKGYISYLCQQFDRNSIFIDHVAAIVCNKCILICHMCSTKFGSFRTIEIRNVTSVLKLYEAWQI